MRWLALALALFVFKGALAHRLSVFAQRTGNKLYIYSYFSDGTPARNAKVFIYSGKGIVASGTTNATGELVVNLNGTSPLRVVVEEPDGHRAEAKLKGKRVEPRGSKSAPIRTDVAEELKEIRRELVKIRMDMERVKLRDVVGGLGWILGIFGAFAFALSKRDRG